MSIILDNTTETIEAKLAATPGTPLEVFCSFVTITSTDVTPANASTTLTNTSDTTVVGSPGASEQRQLKFVSIYNADNITHAVTIKYDNSGTDRRIGAWSIDAGESLLYSDTAGWYVLSASGSRKEVSTLIVPGPMPRPFVGIDAANLTAVKTITSGSTFAYYLGRAESAYTSVTIRARVTTAMAGTITWGEVGIASSPQIAMAGAANLTTRGFTDVAASYNSTGQKSTVVTVTGVVPGMHLWALFGNAATTAAILRGALADDLQSGFFQTAAVRPSTMGAGTAFAVEGATVVPVWGTWLAG